MLILEYKLRVNPAQQSTIDEAIRVVQFIRNKCVRRWMDGRGERLYAPTIETPYARLELEDRALIAGRAKM